MKCRVIVLYGVYQVSDSDCGIQFLPNLSDNCLLWGLSSFNLPAGKFPSRRNAIFCIKCAKLYYIQCVLGY